MAQIKKIQCSVLPNQNMTTDTNSSIMQKTLPQLTQITVTNGPYAQAAIIDN